MGGDSNLDLSQRGETAADGDASTTASTELVLSETKLFRMTVAQTENPDKPKLSVAFLPSSEEGARWIEIEYRRWREVAEQLEYMMRILRKSVRPPDVKIRK